MIPLRLAQTILAALLLVVVGGRAADLAATRAAFLRVIDRPRVALAPEERPLEVTLPEGATAVEKIHFSFASDARQRVPGILVKPVGTTGRRPVVIALHGTGGNRDSGDVRNTLEKTVRAGFIGVAIDGRYHGERTKTGSGATEYNEAIVRAWQTGGEHPFFYDTVWDVMRLLDYLETRPDVDAARIGAIGFSKGGIETYFAAAVDPRIACAVPCIGVQSFQWALENNQWKARIATIQPAFDAIAALENQKNPGADFVRKFYAKIVPGIDGEFDGPAMLPLIAPRPLLVINGDSDANTPIAGVRLSVNAARPLYTAAGADEALVLRIQENTPHRVNRDSLDAAIEWFVRWLKP
jgi:dienelactone hydrolase